MLKPAVTILLAAAIAAVVPTTAGAAAPKPLTAAAPVVGQSVLGAADAKTVAVAQADGSVTLADDAGTLRTLPGHPGCRPSAAGSGLIAWSCHDSSARPDALLVTDLAGADRARLALPSDMSGGVSDPATVAIGTRWARVLVPDPNGKGSSYALLDWHTGARKTIAPAATTVHPDLDAADPVVPYCPGVRAQAVVPWDGYSGALVRPVQFRAPWAIVDRRTDARHPIEHRLLRCGSSHARPVPASFTHADGVALSTHWIAWSPRGTSSTTHLMRLNDRRRYVISTEGAPLLTTGSLWIPSSATSGVVKVYRVRLPR